MTSRLAQRRSAMDSHDRFIVGSLASCLGGSLAGTVAGGAPVLGMPEAFGTIVCFGFVAIIAVPAGFILAFALMPSPHRWRRLAGWVTAIAGVFALLSWGMATMQGDW
jgi:hypothetical protein